MRVETGTCFDCCFWAPYSTRRGDGPGECMASEAPEPVAKVVVHGRNGPAPDAATVVGVLVTPPDYFCACWQDASELQTPGKDPIEDKR